MRLAFLDLESFTAPDQNLMRLLIGKGQIDEVIDEAT